jgi:ADP-ribose pyrophosphatase
MDETIIHTRRVFDGRVVKLDVHDVRLPDGKVSQRELIEHAGAAAIVALDSEQRVLLVRQFRTGAGRVLYEIPAGILNPGEPPGDCAARELQEEAGYKPGSVQALGSFFPSPGYTSEVIHIFLGTDLVRSNLAQDEDEFIEVEAVPLKQALKMVEQGEIIDSKTIIGLLRVARQLGL